MHVVLAAQCLPVLVWQTLSLYLTSLPFPPSDAKSISRLDFQYLRMVSTEELRAEKLFSVEGFVCVVTGGGTGIGLM